jgi:hypothetical protein
MELDRFEPVRSESICVTNALTAQPLSSAISLKPDQNASSSVILPVREIRRGMLTL